MDYDLETVRDIKIQYFDTLPVASSLCVMRAGFLFAASEFGNQYANVFIDARTKRKFSGFYQFASLGEDELPVYASSWYQQALAQREAVSKRSKIKCRERD